MLIRVLFFMAFLITFSLISCNDHRLKPDKSLLTEWKADSLGCNHIRNLEMAHEIAKSEDLVNRSYSFVCKVLGPPNETSYRGNRMEVKYYFQSTCYKGEVVGDFCWVLFQFENGKLLKLPEQGFCQ